MRDLPMAIIPVLRPFESVFSPRVWEWVKILLVGAILAPGNRTVTAVLRVMGVSDERQFQTDHRVLNRAVWSSRTASRILLRVLVRTLVPDDQPIVLGLDDHSERRRGPMIAASGMYRDPVRSSTSFVVTTRGLRWVCMLLLVPIPWAQRVWAWPWLTVLAPAERSHQERGKRHKQLTDWARQLIIQVRRWLPARMLVIVAASTAAALALLAAWQRLPQPVTMVTRLRLDAALYDPAPPRRAGQRGRPRTKGARQPTLATRRTCPTTAWVTTSVPWYGGRTRSIRLATGTAVWYHGGLPPGALRWVRITDPEGTFPPQALLRTDRQVTAPQRGAWFVQRWQREVTFEETRAHLGIETQRPWADLAILRTTPALLGLFSLVTLFAHAFLPAHGLSVRQAAWYTKTRPTCADTLAFVRQHLWPVPISWMASENPDMVKIPKALFDRLLDTLAFAA